MSEHDFRMFRAIGWFCVAMFVVYVAAVLAWVLR